MKRYLASNDDFLILCHVSFFPQDEIKMKMKMIFFSLTINFCWTFINCHLHAVSCTSVVMFAIKMWMKYGMIQADVRNSFSCTLRWNYSLVIALIYQILLPFLTYLERLVTLNLSFSWYVINILYVHVFDCVCAFMYQKRPVDLC